MTHTIHDQHPAISAALEEGFAALFERPHQAPFRKQIPEAGAELAMTLQQGSLVPWLFDCTVRYADGRTETFTYA